MFSTSGCLQPKYPKDIYKIAVISPLSGPYSILGKSIVNGAELAVKEANETNGVNGKEIVLIKEDDGGLVGEGAFFAYRLTRTDMVLGVIGHLNSDISIPASEFYTRANIPQISPGTTSPYFTEREAAKGYVFRTIGRDDTQGKIAASYVINNNFKRVAILYNDRAYGRTLAGEFAKAIKVLPASGERPQIVFYSMIQVGQTDYGALLSQVASNNPDVVFLAGEHDDAGHLIKDFPKYGLEKTQFIGGDGIDHPDFIKIGGINTEGALAISVPQIINEDFIKKYKEEFGEPPTGYSANSYDATNILIEAIRKVGEKDSKKIAQEVAQTKDFPGVTGSITFDEKGDIVSPGFVLSKVIEGKFQVLKLEKEKSET
ncbi:MAG: branched-chain amino acid ABC transporter substrate-binding protein [Candidatus Melainabacteria bacterium]|nr:branched-chain amino acid ABC transporter substrate-binding protein [Candidatus Melainabacteria bacterium]